MRKIKLKLIKDIPNPEFNEIYINPRVRFSNTYDKFLIGFNFKNQSFFDQKFLYSITPTYSTGTGKLTGSGALPILFFLLKASSEVLLSEFQALIFIMIMILPTEKLPFIRI
jgi:hypothetical protein